MVLDVASIQTKDGHFNDYMRWLGTDWKRQDWTPEHGRQYDELVGKSVKQAAYDVQHQAWSKTEVAQRDSRLALAKSLSSTPGLGEVSETARLQSAAVCPTSPF